MDQIKHYQERLKKHGPTLKGVGWGDQVAWNRRAEVLCEDFYYTECSILDVGCGIGLMVDYLCCGESWIYDRESWFTITKGSIR